jgi:hypothetical protein
MFGKMKHKDSYEFTEKDKVVQQAPQQGLDDALDEKYGEINEDEFNRLMKPSGHQKVNPIIEIKDLNCNYPILVNQETGQAMNNHTYYAELLTMVRTRNEALREKRGLEYEIMTASDTPGDQKVDLMVSNAEATEATLASALADDIVTSLSSVACNIEGKIMGILESFAIEGCCHEDIVIPRPTDIMASFSFRYPNHNIPTNEVTASTYFDFVANRKLQIMNNYCAEVYKCIRSVVYDPYLNFEPFDTRDTLYAYICNAIYNDLACLDDALSALITAHCIRIENFHSPAVDALHDMQKTHYNSPSQNKK